jgi:hypothetical protein
MPIYGALLSVRPPGRPVPSVPWRPELRRKLNRLDAENAYVINVWGVGYRLVATA